MRTLTKILLAISILSSLGLGGLARSVHANQPKDAAVVKPRHHARTRTVASALQAKQKHDAVTSPKRHTDENEANESPNDRDGGANEDAH